MKYIFYFIVFIISINSCTSKTIIKEGILIQFTKKEDVIIDQNSIDYKFILLEDGDDNSIGFVEKIEIMDDRIFILDLKSKTLQVYTIDGEFITKIGNSGNGPGEYSMINNFAIDTKEDVITIEDYNLSSYLSYNLQTYEYISTQKIPFYFSSYIEDYENNKYFFARSSFNINRDLYLLKVTDSLFNDINYYLPAEAPTGYGISSGVPFYLLDNKVHFYHSNMPYLYEVNTGCISIKYEIEIEGERFPPIQYMKDITKNNNNYIDVILRSGYIADYKIDENERYIVLSYIRDNETYICFFDKHTYKSSIYTYADFMYKTQLRGIITPFKGKYEDYFITALQSESLKKYSTSNLELMKIKEQITEESNPVICLFRIK